MPGLSRTFFSGRQGPSFLSRHASARRGTFTQTVYPTTTTPTRPVTAAGPEEDDQRAPGAGRITLSFITVSNPKSPTT
jgi:hypothetical protein